MLDAFVTDAYPTFAPLIERYLPSGLLEKLRRRGDPRIPVHQIICRWDLVIEQYLRRWLGFPESVLFAKVDRKLSLAAAKRARRSHSNLLLYHPYAWEAFNSRYPHDLKKILFQFHPHPDCERKILANDRQRTHTLEYFYDPENQYDVDEVTKVRASDCWRQADLILCASGFTKRSLLEAGADPTKCEIVPYGIDLPATPGEMHVPRVFHVVFVGSGIQRKGLHHLLLAWRKADLPKGSRLTLICRFIDRGVRALALVTPGVELVGGVSGDELQRIYAQSALFAMPSLVEGFGQVYLEALAQGCPVLGTPNTGLPDIGPSSAIFLVEPGAIDGLAAELTRLSGILPGDGAVRAEARACAARWPWVRFREDVRAALGSVRSPARCL